MIAIDGDDLLRSVRAFDQIAMPGTYEENGLGAEFLKATQILGYCATIYRHDDASIVSRSGHSDFYAESIR
jgi:hypothetical protein